MLCTLWCASSGEDSAVLMQVTVHSAMTSAEKALSWATAAAARSLRAGRLGGTAEAAATAGAGSMGKLAEGGPPTTDARPSGI